MKKICPNCYNVFDGNNSLAICPVADCVKCGLIEVDDMMVDVFIRLQCCGVGVDYCCAGHLYKRCAKPIIVFDAACEANHDMSLAEFRSLLVEINAGNEMVIIDEVVEHDDFQFLKVEGNCDKDPKKRLENQMSFLSFLYDVISYWESFDEEALLID